MEPLINGSLRTYRPLPQAFANRDDLFVAIRKQLGLNLESTDAPVEVLVIDLVDKPSES